VSDAPIDPFALIGATLDEQYRVDAVVGEGGFGVVYKGWHLRFEQPIAIKALKIPQAVDADTQRSVLAKFHDEAKLYYVLSQASLNIVRAIAFGDLDTPSGIWAPYMVLEWLDGRSLAADLAARRERGLRGRSLAETLALLEPAARGLAYAHSKRVAHRDVKPANLFLTTLPGDPPVPTVKLLDFGIAKVIAEGVRAGAAPTKATAFSSFTPFYAAPEQFDSRLGGTGPWTDVYGFALVLTEVLTDRQAIEEDDAVRLIQVSTDTTSRPTPRARGANVPDVVEAVFRRALSVDPRTRFGDAGELWAALQTAARAAVTPNKLPTTTARMRSRPSVDTAPMPSVPATSAAARSTHVTAPMAIAAAQPPPPPPPRTLAIATPAPMSAWTPPPAPSDATRRPAAALALGCLVSFLIAVGLAVLLGIRFAGCLK
jgi:serine/threonine protein kinase